MAIHQLFKNEATEEVFDDFPLPPQERPKGSLRSTLTTRLCFFLLLLVDLGWLVYNALMTVLFALLYFALGKRYAVLGRLLSRSNLSFRRSAACGLSLVAGLFNPPFGIMVACTYFLMYDKAGLDEVVPTPLQAQFKDIFKD